jgi:hypothetical protein
LLRCVRQFMAQSVGCRRPSDSVALRNRADIDDVIYNFVTVAFDPKRTYSDRSISSTLLTLLVAGAFN